MQDLLESLHEDPQEANSEVSEEFSVPPGSSRDFTLSTQLTDPQPGLVDKAAKAFCNNDESSPSTTFVNVR